MARNKYPEVTVEKVLDASQKLFLEKGFDETTIQDIVNELGGLTKGAIYHHFKSKEEIMAALSNKMFLESNPFHSVKMRKDLNGLQKMKMAVKLNQSGNDQTKLSKQTIPILKNPRILAETIKANRRILSPLWLELIEEGNNDGSIHTQYAKELSELMPLFELWLMPSVYPASATELRHKFAFIKELFDSMGVPVFDSEIMSVINQVLSDIGDMH